MLKETVLEKNRQWGGIIAAAAAAVLSALLSYATADSWVSPLNCAAAAALSPLCSSAVLVGALISYMISGKIVKMGMIICSLVIISAAKWIVGSGADSARFSAAATALSMSFSSLVFGIFIQHSPFNCVMYLLTSAVMSAASYFIYEAVIIISSGKPPEYGADSAAALTIAYLILITSLCGLSFSVVNIGRIAAAFAVLAAAKRFGSIGGSVCGIISMTAVFVFSSKLGVCTVFMGIAGFAAGFAASYKRVVSASIFLAVNFFGQLISGMNDAALMMQADIAIGCVIYMLVPERVLMLGGFLADRLAEPGGEKLVGARMGFAAGALVDVRKNVEDIIKAIENRSVPYRAVNVVSERVCGKCRNKLYCWNDKFERTNADFIKISNQSGCTAADFPSGLSECIHKDKIIDGFERCRKEEAVNKMLSVRLNESRSILFSQMEITESIIESMSDRMNFSYSRNMTGLLRRTLEKYDFKYNTAVAYYNRSDRVVFEIYINDDSNEDTDAQEMSEIISYDMNLTLEVSDIFSTGGETRLRFSQIPKYDIEYVSAQKSAEDSEPSGDSSGFFYDGLGSVYLFISDGMGTGKQAALDSSIVSGLFKRLIRSGIDCAPAVRMINSIMLAKSDEESFATLDICRIDLESGEMTMFKSGASSTLIRYDDNVVMFSAPSSPIGIIRELQVYTKKCSFSEGNIAVMLSDGVDESLYLYIKEQLLNNPELENIAENICEGARKKFPGRNRDDITVSAVRLKLRENSLNMNFA